MRAIETTPQFRRNFKKHSTDPELIYEFIETLANDKPLPDAAHDHALKGRWAGYRECHIRPDLLLIYKKPDQRTLRLAGLGNHALAVRLKPYPVNIDKADYLNQQRPARPQTQGGSDEQCNDRNNNQKAWVSGHADC